MTRKGGGKSKNICNFLHHGNHDWKYCFKNSNSKNFKGKTRNWKEEKENQENRRTRKEIDGESLTSTKEFRMIIGISDSSDSDEIKHSEDNTNNASHMITTKRTKKKAPDTKREKKILKSFENSTQLAVYKPNPSSKRSAATENKLLTKRPNRNPKNISKELLRYQLKNHPNYHRYNK